MTEKVKETYLGDGVYASKVSGVVQLRTERAGVNEYIYLEPEVLIALINFVSSNVIEKSKPS